MASSRSRDYKAEYARQKALRQSEGFSSPYQKRVRGGAGAKPSDPKPEGIELTKARGHRADYLRQILERIDERSLIMIGTNLGNLERNDMGNWDEIPVIARSGQYDEFEFVLYDISEDELEWFIEELDYLDVDYSPNYDLNAL